MGVKELGIGKVEDKWMHRMTKKTEWAPICHVIWHIDLWLVAFNSKSISKDGYNEGQNFHINSSLHIP